jgi:hypothetical protein
VTDPKKSTPKKAPEAPEALDAVVQLRRQLENLCRALGVPVEALENPGKFNGGCR